MKERIKALGLTQKCLEFTEVGGGGYVQEALKVTQKSGKGKKRGLPCEEQNPRVCY